jgi:hypothetical protein
MAMLPKTSYNAVFALLALGSIMSNTLVRDGIAWGATSQLTTVSYSGSFTAGSTVSQTFTPLNGSAVTVSYVVQSGDTPTLVAAGMAEAFNNTVGVSNLVTASSSSTTLSVLGKGTRSFTLASVLVAGGTQTVNANTTDAAAAANIEPGRVVIKDPVGGFDRGVARVKKPATANFTAQTATFTITSASSAIFWVNIKINGIWSKVGPVAHNTNTATTIDDIDTAVDAVMDARDDAGYNLVATNTDTTLILTVDVPGAEIEDAFMEVSGTASADIVGPVYNGSNATYLVKKAIWGVACRDGASNPTAGEGDAVHLGGDALPVAYRGPVACALTTPAATADLWVGLGSGVEGTPYSAGGTSRVRLGSLWAHDGYVDLAPLAL